MANENTRTIRANHVEIKINSINLTFIIHSQ